MRFKPYEYQQVAIDYIISHKNCGLLLDMGLGKTVATLTALKELRDDYFDVNNVLVIAPKRVALDTWPLEVKKWDHLSDISISMLTGTKKERLAGLNQEADIYITTRDLITWLVDELGSAWPFDTVVIDELSSFKSSASKRFKALRKVKPLIRRTIGLTGTPKPNSYMDLWSEMYLLDRGERLEKTITKYRTKYFACATWGGFPQWKLLPGEDKKINAAISDICISMKAKDYLDLKEPTVIDRPLELGKTEMHRYKKLERDYVLQLDSAEITALSGAALSSKLLQLANGAVYDDKHKYQVIHDVKIEALKEMAETGENLLVFYEFQSDVDRILAAIPEARKLETSEDIEAWNRGEVKMIVAHPASAGHGLNLQAGGHIIVWFGLNWSLELYNQANARLHRQGQKEPVIIYRLIASGTLDEKVATALEEKWRSQEAMLEALKARIKEVKVGGAK